LGRSGGSSWQVLLDGLKEGSEGVVGAAEGGKEEGGGLDTVSEFDFEGAVAVKFEFADAPEVEGGGRGVRVESKLEGIVRFGESDAGKLSEDRVAVKVHR